MAKIYPIGVQNFAKLREDGYTYIDKTGFIERLIKEGNCYFLSRPRRFGKSLFLSTLEAFFQGRKDLFEGLSISRSDHDWIPRPVLHFDFTGRNYCDESSLNAQLNEQLREWETLYRLENIPSAAEERFRAVIKAACATTGQKVVILIDEYDKPLLDTVANPDLQTVYRAQLKAVYGNLKKMDAYIEFAMLTGVSRFGKLSIFSDLNNLNDISLSEEYSAICGMTSEEIAGNFSNGVCEFALHNNITVDEAYARLKENYDGYHFAPSSPDMYNPFSVLKALNDRRIGSYWFSTGTPTFLADMIRRMEIDLNELEHYDIQINELMDTSFDLSNAIPIMYQSGYLTIKDYDARFGTVQLDYPNREVRQGFLDGLMRL